MRQVLIGMAGLALAIVPASANEPTGDWYVKDRSARVTIENCGNKLWGVISWEAKPGADNNNPDPSKRGRPMLGLPLLTGMQPTQPNLWEGEIYNPQDGKMYTARISLTSPDTLKLQGCLGGTLGGILGSLACGGEEWTRAAPEPTPAPTKGKNAPRKPSICTALGLASGPQPVPDRRVK
jgi:uncharacterized protein (DUF2147 family)